jgi:purine-cytosine permease-like protein
VTGLVVVSVAGWSAPNSTIYSAGLAFQAIIPKSTTFTVTMIAGGIATLAGIFPAFAMKLLGFVATYGFILAPVGAIIFFDHYFAGKWGYKTEFAFKNNKTFNWAVLLAWVVSMIVFYGLAVKFNVFLSFFTLPAWITCGLLFFLFSKLNR